MSRSLPSACAMPLVISGTATTPPVPVLVAMPAPSRLNQVSSVNVVTPRPAGPEACPNVTKSLTPSKRRAMSLAAPVTTTETSSETLNWPSVADRRRT